MIPLRKEIRELIRASEVMQGLMAREERLSEDERHLVELVAVDLLDTLNANRTSSNRRPDRRTEK